MTEPGFLSSSTLQFLFAGYAVIWAALTGYIWYLANRQRRLEAEIRRLERAVSQERQTS
ncbi:MAG: CcmD family protein [Bacillota bacterium]